MKQTIFTLFLLSTIALVSCHKEGTQLNINQYDQQQIQNYIATNNLVGFKKDSTGGDTSGIYYKILQQPSTANPPLAYTDNISFVFTLKSFDGKYVSSDTVENHYQGYLGHIITDALPYGLQLAIINDLKYYGGSMRILIPSHLAYGITGYGTGSIENVSSHIAGNQCLDYYVHVINAQHDSLTSISAAGAQGAYDDLCIRNYIASDGITGTLSGTYTLDSGVYYKIITPGTGTDPITQNSTLELTAYTRLLNNIVVNSVLAPDSTQELVPQMLKGTQRMLQKHAVKGTTISFIMPSSLAFGQASAAELVTVPVNSCLRFEVTVIDVSP